MLGDGSKVPKWLKAFRASLPATPSALEGALRQVRAFTNQVDLLEVGSDTGQVVAELDAIILAVAVEGAVIDGDLRQSLEELLGRTLWWTGTTAAAREAVLTQATKRATHVARIVNGDRWTTSFCRAGLPLASSVKLRDALAPHVGDLAAALELPDGAHDESLLWLASTVAPAAPELARWQDFADADLRDALRRWLAGQPTSSIAEDHPELWPAVEDDLETLLPWVITRSWLAAIRAYVHACVDDERASRAYLERAYGLLDAAGQSQPPPYMAFYGRPNLHKWAGHTLLRLAEHRSARPSEGRSAIDEALSIWPGSGVRESGEVLVAAAAARLAEREVDEAVQLTTRAYDVAARTGSPRVLRHVIRVRQRMTPYGQTRSVRELDDHLLTGR